MCDQLPGKGRDIIGFGKQMCVTVDVASISGDGLLEAFD